MPASSSNENIESSMTFRLLVVDDDLIQRTIISRIGTQSGFDVTIAETFDEAVRVLRQNKFDCITLDLALGDKSGALLLKTVVASGHRMPVIVISGAEQHVLNSTVTFAESFGLNSLSLSKPLNLTELRNTLLKKRQSAPALRGIMQMSQPVLQAS
jgi:DNA-binding response OmpR family regulator